MEGVSLITPPVHADERGNLIALDRDQSLPFEPKRMYYIFGVPAGIERAGHATSAEAVLIALCGSVKVACDNGCEKETHTLTSVTTGLHVQSGILVKTSEFSPDAVLVVLSSLPHADVSYSNLPFYRSARG